MQSRYSAEAQSAASAMGIDFAREKFTLDDLARGMKVEYEHGRENPKTNVTNDDPLMTAKIALAHLYEKYDYYDGLDRVEEKAPGYWRGYGMRMRIVFYIVLALFLIMFVASVHHLVISEYLHFGLSSIMMFALAFVLYAIV